MVGSHDHVPGYSRNLDSLLLCPARLHLVALLTDRKWHSYRTLRDTLDLSSSGLSYQLATLREAGHIETRRNNHGTQFRMTLSGLERLADHFAALQQIVINAGELVAAARRDRPPPEGTPADTSGDHDG